MNVVVTGGGTIAPIDDVRMISNRSTGRFSAAITEACLERGATVWHIHAPTACLPFRRFAEFDLDTNAEEAELVRLHRLRERYRVYRSRLHLRPLIEGTIEEYELLLKTTLTTEQIDIAFLAMAVSDFRPEPVVGKIESSGEFVLRCRPTPKVIRSVRDWSPEVYLAGFKLLSNVDEARLIEAAREACRVNRAELTVANDFQTVKSRAHRILLVRSDQPVETLGPGIDTANRLVDRVFQWASERMAAREPIPLDDDA